MQLRYTDARMEPQRLTVAILTFRRPDQLAANLDSVVRGVREAEGLVRARVLVVDNDPDASAREVALRDRGVPVDYAHEPRPGIPSARNRALDESASDRLLAFVDDDEIPQAGWLTELVKTWERYDADAVMGRVVSELPATADPWVVAGDFFTRPSRPTGTPLPTAATGNLLLDLDTVRRTGVRFDESLGLGGGEDSTFTTLLTRAGGRIVWCNESVTIDPVPADRATRQWVRHRAFAHGNVLQHTRQLLARSAAEQGRIRVSGFVGGAARIGLGASRTVWGVVVRSLRHRVRGERGVLRGAGVLTASVGYHHLEYRRREDEQ